MGRLDYSRGPCQGLQNTHNAEKRVSADVFVLLREGQIFVKNYSRDFEFLSDLEFLSLLHKLAGAMSDIAVARELDELVTTCNDLKKISNRYVQRLRPTGE